MGEQTAKAPGLNRAKTYQLVLFPLNNGATNVYYVLVLSYIATFGSKVLALSMLFASVMVTGHGHSVFIVLLNIQQMMVDYQLYLKKQTKKVLLLDLFGYVVS